MIDRYNRKELLLGIACLCAGLAGYVCAYFFFRYVPVFVMGQFGVHSSGLQMEIATLVVLLAVSASGYRRWKNEMGFSAYHESGLYHDLDVDSGGSFFVSTRAHRVTGLAFVLSQLFLGGPLMILRGVSHFKNRIQPNALLEQALDQMLEHLRSVNKWQSLSEYPGHEREILLLARMKKIDFSDVKGPRFRAYPTDN